MNRICITLLAVALALPLMAADKKAEPAKTEQKAAPQMKQLEPLEMYALQKAAEDDQAGKAQAEQAVKASQIKHQTLMGIVNSIQQKDGCRIQQEQGRIVCVVQPAPVKK